VTTQLFAVMRRGAIVADGIIWDDDQVTLKWRGADSSVAHWQGLKHAIAVHGHEGTDFVMGHRSDEEDDEFEVDEDYGVSLEDFHDRMRLMKQQAEYAARLRTYLAECRRILDSSGLPTFPDFGTWVAPQ
jgi:hypothetical protein